MCISWAHQSVENSRSVPAPVAASGPSRPVGPKCVIENQDVSLKSPIGQFEAHVKECICLYCLVLPKSCLNHAYAYHIILHIEYIKI